MILFDPSEIDSWAGTVSAKFQFPRLIRQLILATVSTDSLLDMPSDSSIWSGGWDGFLKVEVGNPWVSKGKSTWEGISGWELSAQRKISGKASDVYEKRTECPKGIDPASSTFTFATPRRWAGKEVWIEERYKEGKWAEIRVLDATDIAAWLEQAPAVARWFAQLIGKIPASGFICLDEWWEQWSGSTEPRMTPKLVLAGRQNQTEAIRGWFTDSASSWFLQGDTREEAAAFLAASALSTSAKKGTEFLAKAIVVQTPEAWQNLQHHPFPLVLVRSFAGNGFSPAAVAKGHHVLTLLDGTQTPQGKGQTLPRLGRDETVVALTHMGMTDSKARLMSQRTARRLSVLRRMLLEESGADQPEWVSPSHSQTLVAAMLIGQWDGANSGDQKLLTKLAGKPYGEVDQELSELTNMPDAPVAKMGGHWSFISREEAWYLLAPFLTARNVGTFRSLAVEVLRRKSPQFDLPPQERYLAQFKGKVLPFSDTLLGGITQTLALMGTQHEHMKQIETALSTSRHIVAEGLQDADDWRTWATLNWHLKHLAEAAPEEFLDAVENGLSENPNFAVTLFKQDSEPLLGGAPHTGLLVALEHLAWSSDYFSSVAKILARLAELDPGGQVVNCPLASLVELFRPWIRFTEVMDSERLTVLQSLTIKYPVSGWEALCQAIPSPTRDISNRNTLGTPQWRPWGPDSVSDVTLGERQGYCESMFKLLLNQVGSATSRWLDLLRLWSKLPIGPRQEVSELLACHVEKLKGNPDSSSLRTAIRRKLHHHRCYPDSSWSMEPHELGLLDTVYAELAPDDLIEAHSWLFDFGPCLPDVSSRDENEHEKQVVSSQQEAVQEISARGGRRVLRQLVRVAEDPGSVGTAVARELDTNEMLSLALECLSTTEPKEKEFARGFLRQCFQESDWGILDAALDGAKSTGNSNPEAVAAIYFAASRKDMASCMQRLLSEDGQVQEAYWSNVDERHIMWAKLNEQEFSRAVNYLLAAGRSLSAARLLNHRSMSSGVIVQVLEQIPIDRSRNTEPERTRDGLSSYRISQLFEQLDAADDVSNEVIARLEILYIHELREDRPNLELYKEIVRVPSLFAELTFGSSDGQKDEVKLEAEKRKVIGDLAFEILRYNRELPGMQSDGTVDLDSLCNWVSEARRLCNESGRREIGDQYIGQILANAPADADGLWPCEPVRDALEEYSGKENIGMGFIEGKCNLRGVTRREMYEGGEQERNLATKFREDAANCKIRWPSTAKLLRKLAADYEAQAIDVDNRARAMDEFGLG